MVKLFSIVFLSTTRVIKMVRKIHKKDAEYNRNDYTIPGGANYQLRSKNAVYFNPSNSIKHEMSKALGAYMLLSWGDVKFSKETLDILAMLQHQVKKDMNGFLAKGVDFVTEAVPKINRDRRIDLVRLYDGTWFEFESDHKVDKGHCINIYL